jgi:Carboxypeptidase regulatory-like domain
MSRVILAVCSLAFAVSLSAQISGIVTDPSGAAVDGAPIQLKNQGTSTVARTRSRSDGRYTLAGVSAGSYELTVVMPCCRFKDFTQSLTVHSGKALQFDIHLAESVNGNTPGDDPAGVAAVVRKRTKVPSRPAPRTPEGNPDLSGVWVAIDDPYPETPALLLWAAALVKEREENGLKDAPHNRCLPGPLPVPGSTAPFIIKFVQTPMLLVTLFEDVPGFRQIFLDGRRHPSDGEPAWMGHSIGKWEGEVLVVDTIGFNAKSWIGGLGDGILPETEKLHVTERYSRIDFAHMEGQITFDDPGVFTRPLHMNVKYELAPQEEILEYVCENNKPQHLVGK